MNEMMQKIAQEAFEDELQKIAGELEMGPYAQKVAALMMRTYDPNNANVLALQKKYGNQWKDVAWKQGGGMGPANMVPNEAPSAL